MVKLYELSRLVMPTGNFINNIELFVNKEQKPCLINGAMRNCNVYKFNTWMNLFAPKKHYYYCDLGEIYLKIEAEGNYILQVTGSNRNPAFNRIDDIILTLECRGNTEIKIPDAGKYEGIFYTIIEDKNNPITLKGGAWCTDKTPQRDNKLAIVTCTFKREDYINKNIALFEQFIHENPELNEKIKLIVTDNGKTLDVNRSNDKVKIIPNMNAGGAGGFTRGLMDVMEQNAGFTRVLFMDDDVEIFPESFYRTLMLSNYLKEEYKDAILSGAMLDLYNRNNYVEGLAVQNAGWVTPIHPPCDIRDYDKVLSVNTFNSKIFKDESQKISSAWWYCSYTIDTFKEKGLPMPFFFRCDDIEYNWRNFGKEHIQMNGVSVWHASFEWRVSNIVWYYYSRRNYLISSIIYKINSKKNNINTLWQELKYLIHSYDYISLEIYLKMLKDVISGAKILNINPEKQFMELNSVNKKAEYIICEDENELNYAKHHRVHAKKWRKFVWKIAKHGIYAPDFLFKKRGVALDWYPPKEDFMLVKEIKVYNLFTKKYAIRKFDRKKLNYYEKEIQKLIDEIDKNYNKLQQDYLEAHKEFSTVEFWKEYLEINKPNISNKKESELICQK